MVRASETGALGASSSSPEIRANKPPQIEVQGRKTLTAKVGETVQLSAVVTDDGIPKRRGSGLSGAAVSNTGSRQITAETRVNPRDAASGARHRRKNVRLHVSLCVYRGGHGDVLARPSHVVGRHARGRQFAVGAGVGRAADCRRRQSDGVGDLLGARRLRAALARRRRRIDR